MMTRRTLDGALKWALRDFLREECRAMDVSKSALKGLHSQGTTIAYRY